MDNFRFISWNNDSQIELSLKSFSNNKELKDLKRKLKDKLIKLNGSATFLDKDYYSTNEFREMYFKEFAELIANDNLKSNMSFAWEIGEEQRSRIEKSKEIIQKSNSLNIIGYSFPYYNRKIDLEILNSFNIGPNKKIYIQQPNKETFEGTKFILKSILIENGSLRNMFNPSRLISKVETEIDNWIIQVPFYNQFNIPDYLG